MGYAFRYLVTRAVTNAFPGHVRPLCALAAQMVKLHNVDITFFIGCKIYDKVVEEISRNFEDGEEVLQQRIRYHLLLLTGLRSLTVSSII